MVTKVPAQTLISWFPAGYRTKDNLNTQTHSTRRPGSFDTETNKELGILQYLQPELEPERYFLNSFFITEVVGSQYKVQVQVQVLDSIMSISISISISIRILSLRYRI